MTVCDSLTTKVAKANEEDEDNESARLLLSQVCSTTIVLQTCNVIIDYHSTYVQ